MVKTSLSFAGGIKAEANSVGYLKVCPLTRSSCNKSIIIEQDKVFLAEPYDDENRERREYVIKKVLSKLGLQPPLIASKKIKTSLFCKICEQIQCSCVCLIDLTKQKSNVFIELGMAYGFQKPTIIIFEREKKKNLEIPTDIQGIEYIAYENCLDLENKLLNALKTLYGEYGPIMIPNYDLESIVTILDLLYCIENLKVIPNIIRYQHVSNGPNKKVIIDQGADNGIKKGMSFYIHKKYDNFESEEPIGLLEITYTSEKYSYGKIHLTNLDHIKELESHFSDGKSEKVPYLLKKGSIDKTELSNLLKI